MDDYREFNTTGLTWSPDERLTFTYDHLDRLTSAAPESGGQGYSQAFQYNAIGNLTSFAGTAYAYNDAAHKHAVTHLGGVQKYWYDANGSMTTRSEGGATYSQVWDAENRLTSVTTGSQTTQFFYDGDGTRVKKIEPSGQTTVYVGIHYEKNVTTGIVTSYYFVNSSRAALRQGSTVSYLAQDHLGSGNLTLDSSGNKVGELRYKPYGETRYTWGSTPTDRRFTDQRQEASIGLYDYGARFYSPYRSAGRCD